MDELSEERVRYLKFLILMICAVPFLTSILTWSTTGEITYVQYLIKHYSAPALLLELLVVAFAMRTGMSVLSMLKKCARWQQFALAILLFIALFTMLMAETEPMFARIATMIWLIHGLFFVSVAYLANYLSGRNKNHFFYALFGASSVYVILVAFYVSLVPNPLNYEWVNNIPGYTNVRHTGYFIGPTLGAAIAYYANVREQKKRILCAATIALLACFGFWSGSRALFFSFIVTLMICVVIFPKMRRGRNLLEIAIILVLAACISLFVPIYNPSFGIFHRLATTDYSNLDTASSGRLAIWNYTLPYIFEHPWFGYGADQYRYAVEHPSMQINHPHNLILQLLFQWGVIGAACFMSLLMALWVWSVKLTMQIGQNAAPAFVIFSTILTYSMIDGTLNYPLPIMLACIAVAQIMALRPREATAH